MSDVARYFVRAALLKDTPARFSVDRSRERQLVDASDYDSLAAQLRETQERLRVAATAISEAVNLLRDLRDLEAVETLVAARVAIGDVAGPTGSSDDRPAHTAKPTAAE